MRTFVAITLLLAGMSMLAMGVETEETPTNAAVPVEQEAQSQVVGSPDMLLKLQDSREIRAEYGGADMALHALQSGAARPLSMASADFDEDGTPDLVVGYEADRGGVLTFHRGNVDAVYPNTSEAQARRAAGTYIDAPFLPDARAFETSGPPEFLGAGDFDADGHWDVVTASRAQAELRWHRGDGTGRFGPAESIHISGKPTALVTGEINRRDGLDDLVVGVNGPGGPLLLVFEAPEGALQREPEQLSLPAPATALVLDQMDEFYTRDLLVAAGDTLMFVHGRDRRLSAMDPDDPVVTRAVVEKVSLPFALTSIAVGRFNADRTLDAALLSDTGSLYSAPLAELLRTAREGASPEPALGAPLAIDARDAALLRANVSSLPGDDLLVLNRGNSRVEGLFPVTQSTPGRANSATPERAVPFAERLPVRLPLADGEPVAILPMRLNADALSDLVLLSTGPETLSASLTPDSVTFTVTNTSDSGPGSLRQAILDANLTLTVADIIHFAIPGAGPFGIQPATPLPEFTSPLTIDGTTQPGFAGTPIVTIDGSLLSSPDATGLSVRSRDSVVRGLSIVNFDDVGISVGRLAIHAGAWIIEGNYIGVNIFGTQASNGIGIEYHVDDDTIAGVMLIGGTTSAARNIISGNYQAGIARASVGGSGLDMQMYIRGNYIGTNPAGTAVFGPNSNLIGIHVNNTQIEIGGTAAGSRNVISGHGFAGVVVEPGSAPGAAIIQGNYLGTDVTGLNFLGNFLAIRIESGTNHTIGGTTPAARNILTAGSGGIGTILLFLDLSSNSIVQGNYIGLGADGSTSFGNSAGIILSGGSGHMIGGTTFGAGNVISGCTGTGVTIQEDAIGHTVAGNYIGTDASGMSSRPNYRGVLVHENATNIAIGIDSGTNVISGNTERGMNVGGMGANTVTHNIIGLAKNGTSPLGNGHDGIGIYSSGNRVGGLTASEKNIIAYNGGSGVEVVGAGANANQILANSIYDNAVLGIDLWFDGVTPNDPQDPDTGPNHLQNYPILSVTQTSGSTVRVIGTLDSTPLKSFTLMAYVSPACDSSGYGEGKFHIGTFTVITDTGGSASFDETFPGLALLGEPITMTATGADGTSEFSPCQAAILTPPPEVTGMRFTDPYGDFMDWDLIQGAAFYNLYRGIGPDFPRLISSEIDSCSRMTVADPSVAPSLVEVPAKVGELFWYVITATNAAGEGSGGFSTILGQNQQPLERQIDTSGVCLSGECPHQRCTTGAALSPTCGSCVADICAADPFCCDTDNGSWDSLCVQGVRTICGSLTCPESAGQCPHSLCETGSLMGGSCDQPPLSPSCVDAVCQQDVYCCQTEWDSVCVGEVTSICGFTCD